MASLSLEDLRLFNICLGKQEVALGKEAPLCFELGHEVFVQLYSEKSTGRGHIIGLPDEEARGRPDCRYTVQFIANGRTHDVGKEDIVVELGCSYGKATKILCEQAGVDRVVGVDLGLEALEACQKECGGRVRVAHIDLVSCTEDETAQRLASLRAMLPAPATSESGRQGRFLVFVDIGGDRMAADLQRLIPRLARHEHNVHQIIIKSRELMASLAREAVAELTLIKGAYKPMYKARYGVTRIKSSLFLAATSAHTRTATERDAAEEEAETEAEKEGQGDIETAETGGKEAEAAPTAPGLS